MAVMTREIAAEGAVLPRRVALPQPGGSPVDDAVLRVALPGDIDFIEGQWGALLRGTDADDSAWDWHGKLDDLFAPQEVEHVVLVHDGQVQGTLITTLPVRWWRPGEAGVPGLYVEYVATAPWNRPGRAAGQRFKGVGPVLLRHAVLRSLARGREGRIALHSVAKAMAFYVRVGLNRRGPDPNADELEYFEGDARWAQQFLAPGAAR